MSNMIIVKNFDIILPYEEKIVAREINLTDDPKLIQQMKIRLQNERRGFSRNMFFS